MPDAKSTKHGIAGIVFDPDDRVSGRSRYAADITAEAALHVAFVMSPHPHARITAIMTDEALALPGVAVVLTGDDFGSFRFGRALWDYPPLAVDRVLFVGQRVAAVAAEDEASARAAAALIEVHYEELEGLFTIEEALRPGAPALHPDYTSYQGARDDLPSPNAQGQDGIEQGDPDAAMASAVEVHDHVFSWARSSAAPLETHACLVNVSDGTADVYATHKEPYRLRDDVARFLGCEENHVTVHPHNIGGDFGAKGSPFLEIVCAAVSQRTGRPARAQLSYRELLISTSARHGGHMRLRTGIRGDAIVASIVETQFDGGAFAAIKPRPTLVLPVLGIPMAPYGPVPDRREHTIGVGTNSVPGGQVRSPGEFQATFAGESHIDMIARARGDDPLEFRLRMTRDPQALRVLQALSERMTEWSRASEHPEPSDDDARGIGFAVFHRGAGVGRSVVTCRADTQGVTLRVATPDQGVGSYPTFVALAAKSLRISPDRIRVEAAGAADGIFDRGAGASRVTVTTGGACIAACEALLDELGSERSSGDRTSGNGYWLGAELGGRVIEAVGSHESAASDTSPAHGAMAIEVTVDRRTGKVRPLRAILVLDTGPVINAVGHRGQIEGGFVYGLSQALYEDLGVFSGHVSHDSFRGYKIAAAVDLPQLEVHLLPSDDSRTRAIGELTNLGVAPAIANAVDDAVGVRITQIPITAEKIWKAMPSAASER